jgi:glutamine synthetase
VQIYKHVVHNVANSYGKTATFMPKPMYGDNGSGMHVHQSLWKRRQAAVRGRRLCRPLGNRALLHRRHYQARARPERVHQPIHQFSTSAWCRVTKPLFCSPTPRATARPPAAFHRYDFAERRRVEVRFPDPTANPYLAFAAMLMAGLDGIENKIHPGEAMDKNLYELLKTNFRKFRQSALAA